MPFDGQKDNIGEAAILNKNGGAIAFYGTTRTVYQSYNALMNLAFTRHLFGADSQERIAIGEAVRRAKNELIQTGGDQTVNKLQYSLLGDPALLLAMPTAPVVIDAINKKTLASLTDDLHIGAGETVTIDGHIATQEGQEDNNFNGEITAIVRDAAE